MCRHNRLEGLQRLTRRGQVYIFFSQTADIEDGLAFVFESVGFRSDIGKRICFLLVMLPLPVAIKIPKHTEVYFFEHFNPILNVPPIQSVLEA